MGFCCVIRRCGIWLLLVVWLLVVWLWGLALRRAPGKLRGVQTEMAKRTITYIPSPVCSRFHNSAANIRGIRGPVGSGKSVACCLEIFLASMRQKPCGDGVVRNKWIVLRNTYNELKETTIETWMQWFPQTSMHYSPPLSGRLVVPHIDGSGRPVEIDLLFWGMDQPDSENSLKSLEITGVWANEASQMKWSRLMAAYERCGRYPAKEGDLAFLSHGLIMDTNSPDDSNWWYKLAEVKRPDGMEFFSQPPALLRREEPGTGRIWYEPNEGQDVGIEPAENVEHLNEGWTYYLKQTIDGDEDRIKRLILNQYGTTVEGKPVFPEYVDSIHFSRNDFEPDFGLPIIIGTDFGRTPSAVIGQMRMNGQIRIFEEVLSEGMGVTQFTEELLRPILVSRYRMYHGVRIVNFGDPAGADPGQVDEVTCIQVMNRLGVPTVPSPVQRNSFMLRRECMSSLLRSRRDSEGAIVIGPRCPVLRKGFNGGYHYRKVRGRDDLYTNEPEKNLYSHPHDGLQYLVYGALHSGENFSDPYSSASVDASRYVGGGGVSLGGFGA